jgi:hypothetical protein
MTVTVKHIKSNKIILILFNLIKMGLINCCCNTSKPIKQDLNYESLIKSILINHPLTKYSGREVLEKFMTCEKEYNNRPKEVNGNVEEKIRVIKEYSEEKYLKVLEDLYKMTISESLSPQKEMKRKSNRTLSGKGLLNLNQSRISCASSTAISYINDGQSKDFTYSNKRINQVYIQITPMYNNLFDSLIINKPKSSFILFIISFTKETIEEKSRLFFEILNSADLLNCVISFYTIIQVYILMNINISNKLLLCVNKNFSESFSTELIKEFNCRLSNSDIIQWMERNDLLNNIKFSISKRLSEIYTTELINIVVRRGNSKKISVVSIGNGSNFQSFNKKFPSEVDFKDTIESNKYLEILDCDIMELILRFPFLFDSSKFREELNDVINKEIEIYERRKAEIYFIS